MQQKNSSFCVNVDALVVNLKIVASLHPFEKLSVSGDFLICCEPSYATSVRRWWYGETRQQTLDAVADIVDAATRVLAASWSAASASTIASGARTSAPLPPLLTPTQARHLLSALDQSRGGIANLATTYAADPKTFYMLDALHARISDFVADGAARAPLLAIKAADT